MTDMPDEGAYRDWVPVNGDRDDNIMELCRAKGLKIPNPEISNWNETSGGMTPFDSSPRALVIRWPEPESRSSVRVIKEGQAHSPYILNPGLENNQSIIVVLGGDESLLIIGKLHVRQVRSDHRPW